MKPVRSMTGFAAVESTLPDGTAFTLSLKSVNHRFLDLHLRLPGTADLLEIDLRALLKQAIDRGHVELTLEIGRNTATPHRINDEALDALVLNLRDATTRLGLSREPDLATLLRLPGVLATETRGRRLDEPDLRAEIVDACSRAAVLWNTAREQEGTTLVLELRAGMARLRAASDAVSDLRQGVRQALFDRLRSRLQELLAGTPVSEDRLLAEAALLAEKSDIEEEAVRLRAHIDRFLAILEEGGPVGKRLDFLLQELNREANTTLSKTSSASGPDGLQITNLGLEMKSEIERAREQVQNLE